MLDLTPHLLTIAMTAAVSAQAATPRQILDQIDASRLEPERAVRVERLRIDIGMAHLDIRSGTIYPASLVEGRSVEMVFVGDATLHLDPIDDVERGQLELFTDSEVLDEPISEAVMVVCLDAAVDLILRRAPLVELDTQSVAYAEKRYAEWKRSKEREILGVRAAMLIDADGDAEYQHYFAGQLRSEDLGLFLMLVDPDAPEQFSVGKFERVESTQREEKKIRRQLRRQHREGRLLGVDVEDLGQFDQWVQIPTRQPDGTAMPGYAPFEPRHYDLDVEVDPDGVRLHGTATLKLEAMMSARRVVSLQMTSDLVVTAARGPDGGDLFFMQEPGQVHAFLDEAPDRGTTVQLQVDFEGVGGQSSVSR